MNEIRLAVRSLLKSKPFAVVAILTLVIGIGTTTAVFSVFHAVVLRPLPFPEQERLVDVAEWSATELCAGCAVGMSQPTLADMQPRLTSFDGIAAYSEGAMNLAGGDAPERVSAALVTTNFFTTLGVQPLHGRAFDAGDGRPGAADVVVLSERLFRRRFGGDPAIIGRSVRLNGRPITVVGVMPPSAVLPEFAQLWTVLHREIMNPDRTARELGVVGRLKREVPIELANAEVKRVAADIAAAFPETQKGWTARVGPLRSDVAGDEASLYTIMLGAVIGLWAIVCANLAALLLSRGIGRRREVAVRMALGGSRRAVLWHLFAESVVIAITAGVLGALAASWIIGGLLTSLDTAIPSWLTPRIDGTVLAFCLLLSLLSAVACGLYPAWRATRPNVHEDLKAGGSALAGGPRSRARGGLVVVQLTLSLVLLAVSGVLTATVRTISARQTPTANNLVQARIEPLDQNPAAMPATINALVERLSVLPEARSAAASSFRFIAGFGGRDLRIRAEGAAEVPEGVSPRFAIAVTPRYFETANIPLVAGRAFSAGDGAGAMPVAIINQRLAGQLWPGRTAIGRRVKLGADSLPWRMIVGVTADAGDTASPRFTNSAFVPFAQSPNHAVTIQVAARGDAAAVIGAVRHASRQVMPDVPLLDLETSEQAHQRTWRPYRAYALTLSSIGGIALALAAIGLYGVIAYGAAQRTREIGVRIALGATRADVMRLVSRQGFPLVGLGVVLGLAGAVAVSPVMKGLLFGASPLNLPVFGASAAVLVAVAAVASYLPARRAASTDPMIALRTD